MESRWKYAADDSSSSNSPQASLIGSSFPKQIIWILCHVFVVIAGLNLPVLLDTLIYLNYPTLTTERGLWSSSYHSIVRRKPSSNEVVARKPNFSIARVTSSRRRG